MGLSKTAEYLEFVKFTATPMALRDLKTQGDFSARWNVSEPTLSNWKNEPEFWDLVKAQLKKWGKDKTPNVIMGLYRKAVKDGNAQEAKLWLQYFEDWSEKNEEKHSGEIKVTVENGTIYVRSSSEADGGNEGTPKVQDDSLRPEVGQDNASGQPVDTGSSN